MALRQYFSALLLILAGMFPLPAQEGSTTDVDAMARREHLRREVDEALRLALRRAESRDAQEAGFLSAADRLVALGPEVVPLLAAELSTGSNETALFCAYSLGRLGGPEAIEVLRFTMAQADTRTEHAATFLKAWAAYGLALAGDHRVVDAVDDGRHRVGKVGLIEGMSVLEAIGWHGGEQVLPSLIARYRRFRGASPVERHVSLSALAWTPHAEVLPLLTDALNDPLPAIRSQAVRSTERYDPGAVRPLILKALNDPVADVRQAAALTLSWSPVEYAPDVVRRLEGETDTQTRRYLYAALADANLEAGDEALLEAWGRSDPFDRATLVTLLPRLGQNDASALAAEALDDDNVHVVVTAIQAIAKMQPNGWKEQLIERIDSPVWNVAQTALEQVVEHRVDRARPVIARRLERELDGTVTDPRRFHPIGRLLGALLALEGTQHLPALKTAATRQTDPTLVNDLTRHIEQLEALAEFGSDAERWNATVEDSRRHVRSLGYRQLARIGGAEQARRLVEAFSRVAIEEGVEILRVLPQLDHPPSRTLVRRILTAPEFAGQDFAVLRAEAAWAARRLGGEEMLQALRDSIRHHHARDLAPLVYLGLLGRETARDELRTWARERMRDFAWKRASEARSLDRLLRRLDLGLSLDEFDRPPDRIR